MTLYPTITPPTKKIIVSAAKQTNDQNWWIECSLSCFRFYFTKLLKKSPIAIKVIIPEIANPASAITVSAMKNPINPETNVALIHNWVSLNTFLVKNATTMAVTMPTNNPPPVRLL